ncbi:MAG: hypothetical protein ABII09_03695 [Planctomycetota bacterium]
MERDIRTAGIELPWMYKRIRPHLMTGDIVLFNGRGVISDVIGFFTRSKMSHVGMIVRTSYQVDILEADWGKSVKGVQLNPFGEKCREYKGEIFIRFLNCERDRLWFEQLHKFISEHRGTSYEKGLGLILELLGAALRINRHNEHNLFCSELLASIFKRWGYLPPNVASNNYQPKDFEPDKKVDVLLRSASLLAGERIWLSPLQAIVR